MKHLEKNKNLFFGKYTYGVFRSCVRCDDVWIQLEYLWV